MESEDYAYKILFSYCNDIWPYTDIGMKKTIIIHSDV